VQEHFRARAEDRAFDEDDLVAAFRAAWVSEGFLSRDTKSGGSPPGEDALRRFFRQEHEVPSTPTGIEEDFTFFVDRTRVQGRYDLVVEDKGAITILDFKTGVVGSAADADKRAKEASARRLRAGAPPRQGRLPDRVELRFLESGIAGGQAADRGAGRRTEQVIRETERAHPPAGIRARPSYLPAASAPSATSAPSPRAGRRPTIAKFDKATRYPRSRIEKLGVKAGSRVTTLGIDEPTFLGRVEDGGRGRLDAGPRAERHHPGADDVDERSAGGRQGDGPSRKPLSALKLVIPLAKR
jgi:hypothetical protein